MQLGSYLRFRQGQAGVVAAVVLGWHRPACQRVSRDH